MPCLVALLVALLPSSAAAAATNVFGTVFDSTGKPVLNVVVGVALVDAGTGATVATTTTDPTNASYAFSPAAGGTFNITATPPSGSGLLAQTRSNVVVPAGATLEVDFHLPPVGTLTVSGHVLDQLGAGLAGQIVEFIDASGTARFPLTPTDAAGAYSVQLPVGSYRWEMHNTNATELRAPQSYDLQTSALVGFSSDTVLDLRLPTVHIVVTVLDTNGAPVPGTQVFTDQSQTLNLSLGGQTAAGFDWYQPPAQRPAGQTYYPVTDGAGVAGLWLFPSAAQHVLTAVPPAGSGLATTSWSAPVLADGSTSIHVAPVLTLSGRVLDPSGAPVAGQTVTAALNRVGAPLMTTVSDGAGAYAFSSLAGGTYQVGMQGANASSSVRAPQSYTWKASSALAVSSDTVLDLPLPETPVKVTVTGAGSPLSGVGLTASLAGGSCPDPSVLASCFQVGSLSASGTSSYVDPLYAPTAADGTSTLWLFPGTYQVVATPSGGSVFASAAAAVTVAAGDVAGSVTIALGSSLSLTGHVLDGHGGGLGGQFVTLVSGALTFGATSAADGSYVFSGVPAGSYTLSVSGGNAGGANAPPNYRLTLSQPVRLLGNLTLELALPEVAVTAVVTGPAGPAAGVPVSFALGAAGPWAIGGNAATGLISGGPAVTGADGRAQLWLFPGTYSLTASPANSLSPSTVTVTVGSADVTVPFALPWIHAAPVTSLSSVLTSPTTAVVALSARTFGGLAASITYTLDGAGPFTYAAPFVVSGSGSHVVTFAAVDAAGVIEPLHTQTVVVAPDTTPPVIVPLLSPAAPNGLGGWYVSPVTVSWSVTDPDSAVTSSSGCAASVVSAQGVSVLTCTATSAGGTASRSAVVALDSVPPVLSWTGLPAGGVYSVDQDVALVCTAVDATSGVASPSCGAVQGPAWSFGAGVHTVSGSAVDRAGNAGTASVTFRVVVTPDGVCALVRRWESKSGVAQSLCVKASHGDWGAFVNEVRAQSGKSLTSERAAVLEGLAASAPGSSSGRFGSTSGG